MGLPTRGRPSAQAKARRRGQERKSRKMRRGVAGGRDWSACRRHVPCTRSGCKIWILVCHAASSLLWACVFAAASVALESRRHRSGRSQRGVVTTAPRHRRETACYTAALQAAKSCSHGGHAAAATTQKASQETAARNGTRRPRHALLFASHRSLRSRWLRGLRAPDLPARRARPAAAAGPAARELSSSCR